MRNDHWKTYITDYKHITGESNWLRIESTFKPSPQDIKKVTWEKGFKGDPSCVEINFHRTIFITTWSVTE